MRQFSSARLGRARRAAANLPMPSWRFEGLAAGDELIPIWNTGRPDGFALQRGTTLFVTGARVCDRHRLPFLDRIDLPDDQRSTVFVGQPELHEHVVAVLNDDASLLLTVYQESPEEPPDSASAICSTRGASEWRPHAPIYTAGRRSVVSGCAMKATIGLS